MRTEKLEKTGRKIGQMKKFRKTVSFYLQEQITYAIIKTNQDNSIHIYVYWKLRNKANLPKGKDAKLSV